MQPKHAPPPDALRPRFPPCYRMALALSAFHAAVEAAARRQEQGQLAVSWYGESLQARALGGWCAAVKQRRQFEGQLAAVARSMQLSATQEAFGGWRAAAALCAAEGQMVASTRRRLARLCLAARFAAGRGAAAAQQQQRARMQAAIASIAGSRMSRALGAWRRQAAERGAEKRAVAAVQR